MLRADAAAIRQWRAGGRDVYVYFNNDGRAAAVRNALRLTELLEVPAPFASTEGHIFRSIAARPPVV
jgi:uncharacterized protein YecE (DUF72 family)